MRKINLKAEITSPQHGALIFFAQALDEQLYDLTDDSFKAPALNTYSRTLELQGVALANHSAGIAKEALKPFIEELEASIGKDPALTTQQKALCKVHIININENLSEADRIARGVSGLRMVMGDYFALVINAIKQTITKTPNNKKDLLLLTSAFIVQAEILGYPRRHSFYEAHKTLLRHLKYEKQFNPTELLEKFFSRFSNNNSNYECLYIASGPFQKYPQLLNEFRIEVLKEKPDWPNISQDQKYFLESIKESQNYIKVKIKPKPSPAQAHKVASNLIGEFIGVVRFYSHTEEFSPSKLSLVRDLDSGKIYLVHEAPDPMHCWVSHANTSEEEMLDLVKITHGTYLTENSSNKLRRTIRLHRSALRSNSAENQLIDLWAGLEGLVSRPGKESQRIDYFSECLLPCLTLSYPEKIFMSAYTDMQRLVPGASTVIQSIPGAGSNFSKFIRLILCPEHKNAQTNLTELLLSKPLLMNRIWRLSELFKNRGETQQTLRHHRQKVKWHLSRIYHTRNSIMHSASAMPYLPTLVENLHVYLDTLIKSIQKVANTSPERQNIDGILQYLSSWEKYRLQTLTTNKDDNEAPLTDTNVWDVVFGVDMALTPSIEHEPAIGKPLKTQKKG